MNYRTILIVIVIASVVVLIAVTFIMYKQSANNIAQPLAEQTTEKQSDVLNVGTEQKLQEQVAPLVAAGDMSACNQVQDDMYKKVCINNIALRKAEETKDISYCQYLDDKLISRESCERQVILQKSVEIEDVSICRETKNETLQKECENTYYSRLAQKKQKPSLCDLDINITSANQCWNRYYADRVSVITVTGEDPVIHCDMFRGEEVRTECEVVVDAMTVGDFEKLTKACQLQKTGLFIRACLSPQRAIVR